MIGVASIVWVRPILTILANSLAFLSSALCILVSAGIKCRASCEAAAMCMALGTESLDDWLILTWSLGCTGFFAPSSPPSARLAILAITSLTFMLDCVPEPVCQTDSGKCSSSLPSAMSCATATIAPARFLSSEPRSRFTSAAARLTSPSACTISIGMRSVPIRKLRSERSVCAPHNLSAAMSSGPNESLSLRVLIAVLSGLSALSVLAMDQT